MGFLVLLIAAVLGCLFPAYLIDAVRAEDEKIAADKRGKACATFGAIVFLIVLCLMAM